MNLHFKHIHEAVLIRAACLAFLSVLNPVRPQLNRFSSLGLAWPSSATSSRAKSSPEQKGGKHGTQTTQRQEDNIIQ